jgi:hypothetical protein
MTNLDKRFDDLVVASEVVGYALEDSSDLDHGKPDLDNGASEFALADYITTAYSISQSAELSCSAAVSRSDSWCCPTLPSVCQLLGATSKCSYEYIISDTNASVSSRRPTSSSTISTSSS